MNAVFLKPLLQDVFASVPLTLALLQRDSGQCQIAERIGDAGQNIALFDVFLPKAVGKPPLVSDFPRYQLAATEAADAVAAGFAQG